MATFDFIRYANCWEDTNILLKSLKIKNGVGLSVLSGGDNTFAMLTQKPDKIVAFDINETQIHLFNLKKAGFKNFDYDDLIALLGVYDTTKSYKLFLSLEGKMENDSFRYFLEHPIFFKKGIINIGKFEGYFQMFKKHIIPLFATRGHIEQLASFKDVVEQREYFNNVINNKRLNLIFDMFFGFRAMGKFGRDKSFYDYVEDKKNSGLKFKEHFNYGVTHVANYDNPYINYILTNRFHEGCLPVYLKKEHFNTIKTQIDKIEIFKSDLLGIEGKYDFFNLSDIFEYMDDRAFCANCEKLKSLARPNARIAYYNMQGKRYLDENSFQLLTKLSQEMTQKMQAYFYDEFLVYKVKK